MNVPAQVKQRVEQKIREGIAICEKKYARTFAMPTVSYDLRGTTAGTADYRKWHINLNATLMMANLDDFIARTVPHELAHLITDRVYPEAHNRGIKLNAHGGFRRQKREVHGPRWQSVMHVLGADPSRCHSYDTSVLDNKHKYVCSGCKKEWNLGPKHHKAIQEGNFKGYRCKCKTKLAASMWVGAKPATQLTGLRNVPGTGLIVAAPAVVKPTVKPAATGSKLEQCYNYYKQYAGRDKELVCAVFVNEVGMTKAGAQTYFYKCREMYQKGV